MSKRKKRRAVYVVSELRQSPVEGWVRMAPVVYCHSEEEARTLVAVWNPKADPGHCYMWDKVPRAPRT